MSSNQEITGQEQEIVWHIILCKTENVHIYTSVTFRGAVWWILLSLDRARPAVFSCWRLVSISSFSYWQQCEYADFQKMSNFSFKEILLQVFKMLFLEMYMIKMRQTQKNTFIFKWNSGTIGVTICNLAYLNNNSENIALK